jgi:lipoate-protein ligase A
MLGLMKMGLNSILSADPPSVYSQGNLPCFSYPARNEIELNGKKIIGSAQKRIGSRFIQHGSIPLEEDGALLESVSRLKEGEEKVRMTSLSQALGIKVSFESAVEYLKAGFSEYFRISPDPKTFDEKEKEAIIEIQKQRYERRDWTFFRRDG